MVETLADSSPTDAGAPAGSWGGPACRCLFEPVPDTGSRGTTWFAEGRLQIPWVLAYGDGGRRACGLAEPHLWGTIGVRCPSRLPISEELRGVQSVFRCQSKIIPGKMVAACDW